MAAQTSVLSDIQVNNDYGTMNYHPTINIKETIRTVDNQTYSEILQLKATNSVLTLQLSEALKQNGELIKDTRGLHKEVNRLHDELDHWKEEALKLSTERTLFSRFIAGQNLKNY